MPWGGSEVLWSKTAQHLNNKFEINFFIKKWAPEPEEFLELKKSGVKCFYKYEIKPKHQNSLFSKVRRKIYYKDRGVHQLQGIIKNIWFDLIVLSVGNHVDPQIFYYCDYLKKRGIPYVIIIQLATDLRNLNDPIILRLKVAYENALKVYFLSKENKEKTELQLAVKLDNFEFINNPFYFNQAYLPYKNEQNDYTLGCVSSFTSFHKGQDLLVQVLSRDKWRKRNIIINFYGQGINEQQIKRLIRIHNLEDKVFIKGFEKDKTKIWEKNMACIMTSRMEGQSLAILEAMASGRMIISAKVGDAERLIDNDKTGFIIPAATTDLIDETLEQAWKKREDWLKMGKCSRAKLYKTIEKDPVIAFSEKIENLLK